MVFNILGSSDEGDSCDCECGGHHFKGSEERKRNYRLENRWVNEMDGIIMNSIPNYPTVMGSIRTDFEKRLVVISDKYVTCVHKNCSETEDRGTEVEGVLGSDKMSNIGVDADVIREGREPGEPRDYTYCMDEDFIDYAKRVVEQTKADDTTDDIDTDAADED